MTIHLYYHSIEVVGFTSLVLLAVSVLRFNPHSFSARMFTLMMLSACCFLVRSRQEFAFWIPDDLRIPEATLAIPIDIFMNAFSGLFMIYAFSLFRENSKFPRWLLAIFAFQMSLETISLVFSRAQLARLDELVGVPVSGFFFYELMRLLQVFFAAWVVYWTISGWRSDLVQRRRLMRLVIVGFQGCFSLLMPILYIYILPRNEFLLYQVHVGIITVIALLAFAIVCYNFKLETSIIIDPLRLADADPEDDKTDPGWDRDWQRFDQRFKQDHLYRQPGLSIASLSEKLSIPEYRLRKLIHQKLGYRNFNKLLHAFRIREACEVLADPGQSNTPILTIALSAGYQSINPFNRAFREIHGTTPSEYRMRASDQQPATGMSHQKSENQVDFKNR